MKCDHIQELLLTDYQDGECDVKTARDIKEHLSSCLTCQEFNAQVEKLALKPFEGAKPALLSQENVWQKIKQKIEEEDAPDVDPISEWVGQLIQFFHFPRGVFAALVMVVLVIAVYWKPIHQQISKSSNADNEIGYLSDVVDEIVVNPRDDNYGYGTDLEEYFL